jgi:3-oxosteroid 1-dehydrogenase
MSHRNGVSRRGLLLAGGAGLGSVALAHGASPRKTEHWDTETDVLVCGSGAAGATAAMYACEAGARVMVVEKGSAWGGTTAKSGCHIWIPDNFELRKRGVVDDKRACLQYMANYSYPQLFNPDDPQLGLDSNTYELLSVFYDNGAAMVDQMMAWNAFTFRAATIWSTGKLSPDYFDHSPYNRVPRGRGLEPVVAGSRFGAGRSVVDTMRRALLERGCEIRMRHRALELFQNDRGVVTGALVQDNTGNTLRIRARRGVVFATGCYSHNKDYLRQHQMMPVFGSCAVPTNEGDFIAIAGAVGAQMTNMSGAWRGQVVLEDCIRYRSVPAAVYWPPGDSMLLVDRTGRRCVNEKRSYNDRVRQLYNYDATEARFPHLLNFMIYDQRTADLRAGHYPIPPVPSAAGFVLQAQTLAELAGRIAERLQALREHTGGVMLDAGFAAQLEASVARFNGMAEAGVDEDFGRGNHAEDREWGAFAPARTDTKWPTENAANPTLYPLQERGPFYAIILAPGVLGTNGGPKINARAEVLDYRDNPIPGLYAAGNCMGHPAANAYWAAGATIGSAMTFGKIAGEYAATRELV